MAACRFPLAGLAAGSCSGGPIVSLADGQITVSLNPSLKRERYARDSPKRTWVILRKDIPDQRSHTEQHISDPK